MAITECYVLPSNNNKSECKRVRKRDGDSHKHYIKRYILLHTNTHMNTQYCTLTHSVHALSMANEISVLRRGLFSKTAFTTALNSFFAASLSKFFVIVVVVVPSMAFLCSYCRCTVQFFSQQFRRLFMDHSHLNLLSLHHLLKKKILLAFALFAFSSNHAP